MADFKMLVYFFMLSLAVSFVQGHRNCTKTRDCRRKECCVIVGDAQYCSHWAELNTKCRVSQQNYRLDKSVVLNDFCPCDKDLSCNHVKGESEDVGKCEPKRCTKNKDCAWRHCCVDGFCRRRGVLGDQCIPGKRRRRNKMMTEMCDCLSTKFYCRDDGYCERK